MNLKLKKGDQVLVISGKDRNKQAKIEKVFPKTGKIVVAAVNRVKVHLKPSKKNPHGGIIDKFLPIDATNVLIICPRCGKPTRVGHKLLSSKKKIRICKKCQESIEQNV